jgi:hypothetical protein
VTPERTPLVDGAEDQRFRPVRFAFGRPTMSLVSVRTHPTAANDNEAPGGLESRGLAFWGPVLLAWTLLPAVALAGLVSVFLWVK